MSAGVGLAAGVTRWWVGAYTRTAPDPDADDRRAEVESDLFEQQAAANAATAGLGRALLGRTLRGMPDDLAWRLDVERAPGRLQWHLAHPTTTLGSAMLVGFVLGQVADVGRGRLPLLGVLDTVLNPLLTLLWAATLGFAAVAIAFVRPRWRPRAVLEVEPWRCAAVCVLATTGAAAGLWRWAPGQLGEAVSVVWGMFGVSLLVWLATFLVRLGSGLAAGLDFRKIPS